MRITLRYVLACGALVALGACSDYDASKMTFSEPDPDPPVTGTPPSVSQEVGESAVGLQAAADTLAEARTAADDAQEAVEMAQTALEADPTNTALQDALAQAQQVLAAAQDVVAAAQMEVQAARSELFADLGVDEEDLGVVVDTGSEALTMATAEVGTTATALAEARTAADDAQEAVEMAQTALEADPANTALQDALAQAQQALAAAQEALTAAATEYQSALDTLLAEAQSTLEDSQTENPPPPWAAALDGQDQPNPLANLEPLEPLAATGRFAATGAVTVERTPREVQDANDAWMTNPNALAIATEAVAYEDGKTVIGSETGLTDELPARGIAVRGNLRDKDGNFAGNDGKALFVAGEDEFPSVWHVNDAVLNTSFQLTADGLVMKTGGPGNIHGDMKADLDASTSSGRDGDSTQTADNCTAANNLLTCNDFNRDDLTIAFGRPVQSPAGDASYYWNARVPLATDSDRNQAASEDVMNAIEAGRPGDLGHYELYLSNHVGTDSNDDHLYLSHAAYGLFTYVDNHTGSIRPGRLQAFHFGYDAFDSTSNPLPGTAIMGTFEGRTMAWLARHGEENQGGYITGLTRLRADVTLNAVIGGANTVTGEITNFQNYKHGTWYGYNGLVDHATDATRPAVKLVGGTIAEDGSFSGTTEPSDNNRNVALFDAGEFGGNFYGPAGGLEAAGYWTLLEDSTVRATAHSPLEGHIIGTFGAVCTDCP